jgi:uncharacterized membrane protein YphA (DoxX/SURF4 family)
MKDFNSNGLEAPAQRIHYTLRIASAMCFIGHGAFGIITKPVWCNYFAVFGIGHDMSYRLMPLLGTVDILLGLSLLFYPLGAVAGWLVTWGLITASLRPLSGESVGELIERAGNYGAPLALLLLSKPSSHGFRSWWSTIDANPRPDAQRFTRVILCLRIVVFLLLLGHGWLNWIEKKSILAQYTSLGFSDPIKTAHIVGIVEMLAALALLIRPARPLLLALFIWKMGTELFYPHWEIVEWVERAGSYGSLLALWLALSKTPAKAGFRNSTSTAMAV